jgi:hypothetical protein
VLDELAKITEWTGGGLHAEGNPSANQPPDCVMVLKMENTAYVQALPTEQGEFACDPEYRAEVSPTVQAVVDAKLGSDRVSTAYTSG